MTFVPRWLLALGVTLAVAATSAAPATAQDAATLGRLPEVTVLTTAKAGDWDDLGDLIGEALEEVEETADERDLKLSQNPVVIYEVMGLKNFRARIGYILDAEAKVKPGRFGKGFEVRQLKGPAYVAVGIGGAAEVNKIRRKALDQAEKPGVRRLKGVETIDIFYGEMDGKDTKVEIYAPLAER